MRRVLFDINVVLDVLLDRQPWVDAAAAAWRCVETGATEGMLAAHAVTTLHYLLRKELGNARAKRVLSAMLGVFAVAPVTGMVVTEALGLEVSDFEDAVTAVAARVAGCDWIVTRDQRGFRGSPVRAVAPEGVVAILGKR
jgi:predicted nucleic acid-binding protein